MTFGLDFDLIFLFQQENWSDFHEVRDGRFNSRKGAGPPDLWMPPDFPESSQFGSRRQPVIFNFQPA